MMTNPNCHNYVAIDILQRHAAWIRKYAFGYVRFEQQPWPMRFCDGREVFPEGMGDTVQVPNHDYRSAEAGVI